MIHIQLFLEAFVLLIASGFLCVFYFSPRVPLEKWYPAVSGPATLVLFPLIDWNRFNWLPDWVPLAVFSPLSATLVSLLYCGLLRLQKGGV